jgi:hypothetical protein
LLKTASGVATLVSKMTYSPVVFRLGPQDQKKAKMTAPKETTGLKRGGATGSRKPRNA